MRKKSKKTSWSGRGRGKEVSFLSDGLVYRYDPRLRAYEVIMRLGPNMYLHFRIADKALEDMVLSPSFDTEAFHTVNKLTVLQWSRLDFASQVIALANYVGLDKIPKVFEEEMDARKACSLLRMRYENNIKFLS